MQNVDRFLPPVLQVPNGEAAAGPGEGLGAQRVPDQNLVSEQARQDQKGETNCHGILYLGI